MFTETGECPMRNHRVLLSTMLLTVLLVAPSFAHHNITAVYDTTKPLTIKGTITKVDWRNPHVIISVDVKDASGKITNWLVEATGTTNMTRAGLDQNLIDLSLTYSIETFQAKDGSPKAVGITLTFPDSKSFDISEKVSMTPTPPATPTR
jgi:hypothetical protein